MDIIIIGIVLYFLTRKTENKTTISPKPKYDPSKIKYVNKTKYDDLSK